MGRTDGRPNPQAQEKKPPPAAERPQADEGRQAAWFWAAAVWAVFFMFLVTLALYDLVAGLLFRG
jgi:hypothetical protein